MNKEIIDKIFKSYDIRGIAESEVTEELAYAVANAFAQHKNLRTVVVGRDGRTTSLQLTKAVINGLLDAGCDVVNIGLASTPLTKWSVAHLEASGGIMVSASHNPPEYNGFKFYLEGGLSYGKVNGLHDLKALLESSVQKERGTVQEQDTAPAYIAQLTAYLDEADAHVFIDPSGGVACREVTLLAEQGNYNFTLYNAQMDPTFSVHSPNPLDEDSQEAAKDYCAMNKCIGVILDADADRCIFVDEEGQVVPADVLGAWLVQKTLQQGQGVVATVNCTQAIQDYAANKNSEFTLSAVGHANVMQTLVESGASMGIEKSGHMFFKEFHNAEAPLFCLLRVLRHLSGTLAKDIKSIRERYLCSDETNVHVEDKEGLLAAAKTHYAQRGELIEIDGMLCQGEDWWVSIRASNTEPLVRITWEAKDQETYAYLQAEALGVAKPFLTSFK